jgi:hypothetical protein
VSRLQGIIVLAMLAAALAGCGGGSSDSPITVGGGEVPYSYTLPQGFEEASTVYPGKDPKFATTVVPAGTPHQGYVGIYEVTLSDAERGLPADQLLKRFEGVERDFYGGEGAALGPGRPAHIAEASALCWRIHHFENPYEGVIEADSCAIADGRKLLLQTCTWKPQSAGQVHRGCEEMRATLSLR